MDFVNLLIVIVGVGTVAVFAFVLSYAGALGFIRVWGKIAHRHHGHHAH